jgi:predicted MPP superfamily phosphohydrolase
VTITKLNSEKRLTRRNFIKKGLTSVVGFFILSLSSYSFFIEKNNIELKHIHLSFPHLPSSFKGTKILHISDIHFGFFYDSDQLQNLIVRIRSLEPDIICFTGDLIDSQFSKSQAINVSNILKQLVAPYGKFAILGNHNYWGNTELVKDCLTDSGFQLLMNEVTLVRKGNDYIYISGIDDLLCGTPDISKIFKKGRLDPNLFHVMLVHEPDYANEISYHPVDLQLSGHSHGGQINLPYIGPLITPALSKKYTSGLYRINNRLNLYTNRGIGTTILPFRFYCRPEITIIELNKSES